MDAHEDTRRARRAARDQLRRHGPRLAVGCQNRFESGHRSPLHPAHYTFNDCRNIPKVQLLVEERLHRDLIGSVQTGATEPSEPSRLLRVAQAGEATRVGRQEIQPCRLAPGPGIRTYRPPCDAARPARGRSEHACPAMTAAPAPSRPRTRPANAPRFAGAPRYRCRAPASRTSTLASISSRPLFIRVAESTEILRPMFQRGCAQACAGVALATASAVQLRNGPPEAVSSRRRTPAGALPARKPARQTLEDSVVFAVDRNQFGARSLHSRDQQRPRHDRRFLVGEHQPLACPGSGQRGGQARGAADGRHDIICRGLSRPARRWPWRRQHARAGFRPGAAAARAPAAACGDSSAAHSGSNRRHCSSISVALLRAASANDAEAFRMQRQHFQRVDADACRWSPG